MGKVSKKDLESQIQSKCGLAVGDLTLDSVRREVIRIMDMRVRISGRSVRSGRRSTINIRVRDLIG